MKFKLNKVLKLLCIFAVLFLTVGCGKEKGIKVVNLVKEENNNVTITKLFISKDQYFGNTNLLESNLKYDDAVTVKLSKLFEVKEDQKISVTVVDDEGKSYIWYDLAIEDGDKLEMHYEEGMIYAYVVAGKNNIVPYNPNTIVLP